MKINVVTPGRSHLLDMSRELLHNGHDVRFYTMVSPGRCEQFGFPRDRVVSFYWICAPLMFLFRKIKFPGDFNRRIYYTVCRIVDALTSLKMGKADLLVTISGCGLKSMRKAKRSGALLICDRGAKHILDQEAILAGCPGAKQVYKKDIGIELQQYDLADYMAIPSTHVKQSFEDRGFSGERLFVNPYGVDVSRFKPTELPVDSHDVIFVGNWSMQKGADILADTCRRKGFTLLHVGSIADCEFPDEPGFTHVDPVDQNRLPEYYRQARVFCLPSRQDGFGLVLFQAMACGLPLVYSVHTGGPDVRNLIKRKEYLHQFDSAQPEALGEAIEHALSQSREQKGVRQYLDIEDYENITWEAYGKRYNEFLKTI